MKKMQEKSKIYNIQDKAPTPPQIKANHKLPLNPSHMDDNIKLQTQEGSNQNSRFLNVKDHTPLESKTNQTKHQIQPKTPTPPKVENPRFYQLSLDKPQGKHRPLEQQTKSKHI
jgi:hypothetical protein